MSAQNVVGGVPTNSPPLVPSDVPGELWIEVALELDALDVLALSQACKLLHGILSGRETWIKVLQAICQRHGVFFATHPTAEMVLRQIQLAAMRPQRWQQLVQRRAVPPELLGSADEVQPVMAERRWDLAHPRILGSDRHLIPGGRYLVGCSPHKTDITSYALGMLVQVWDLGPAGMPSRAPVVVATYPFNVPAASLTDVKSAVSILDDSMLRIVVTYPVSATPSQTSVAVETFDTCFESEELSFSRVSSLSISSPNPLSLITVHTHKQYVALLFGDVVVLWDIKEHRYSQWLDAVTQGPTMALPTENFVVSFGPCGLSAWETTTLGWANYQDATPVVDIGASSPVPPSVFLQTTWVPERANVIFLPSPHTHPGPDKLVLDVHGPGGETQAPDIVGRYQVNVNVKEKTLTLSTLSMARLTYPESSRGILNPRTPFYTAGSLPAYQLCFTFDLLYNTWMSLAFVPQNSHRTIVLMARPKAPGDAMDDGDGNAIEAPDAHYVALQPYMPMQFCQMSGRVIYSGFGPGGIDCLYIVDYLG